MLGLVGFFAMGYYMFSVFDISQKQTMLVRTQAFIELGNYSYYGGANHGEDDAKSETSQVRFELGKSAKKTKISVDDAEPFKKAVDGELTIDVTRARTQDSYWQNYNFPKRMTHLVWLDGENGSPMMELDLSQSVAIAHNRSIKLGEGGMDGLDGAAKKTGIFSGSVAADDWQKLVQAQIAKGKGLVDNVDELKLVLRELVKNDPSLADEAAEVEKSLSAADSLGSMAQAALISMAIQVAMDIGMAAMADMMAGFTPPEVPADAAGSAAGTAAQQASNVSQYFENLAGNFTNPMQGLSSFANETFLKAPLESLASPVTNVTGGFAGFTGGLAKGGLGGLFQSMQGVSQMMQTVQLVGSFTGMDSKVLNSISMAGMALNLPGAVTSGIKNFQVALKDINTAARICAGS